MKAGDWAVIRSVADWHSPRFAAAPLEKVTAKQVAANVLHKERHDKSDAFICRDEEHARSTADRLNGYVGRCDEEIRRAREAMRQDIELVLRGLDS